MQQHMILLMGSYSGGVMSNGIVVNAFVPVMDETVSSQSSFFRNGRMYFLFFSSGAFRESYDDSPDAASFNPATWTTVPFSNNPDYDYTGDRGIYYDSINDKLYVAESTGTPSNPYSEYGMTFATFSFDGSDNMVLDNEHYISHGTAWDLSNESVSLHYTDNDQFLISHTAKNVSGVVHIHTYVSDDATPTAADEWTVTTSDLSGLPDIHRAGISSYFYSTSSLIDFVGTPREGRSPLEVTFEMSATSDVSDTYNGYIFFPNISEGRENSSIQYFSVNSELGYQTTTDTGIDTETSMSRATVFDSLVNFVYKDPETTNLKWLTFNPVTESISTSTIVSLSATWTVNRISLNYTNDTLVCFFSYTDSNLGASVDSLLAVYVYNGSAWVDQSAALTGAMGDAYSDIGELAQCVNGNRSDIYYQDGNNIRVGTPTLTYP